MEDNCDHNMIIDAIGQIEPTDGTYMDTLRFNHELYNAIQGTQNTIPDLPDDKGTNLPLIITGVILLIAAMIVVISIFKVKGGRR